MSQFFCRRTPPMFSHCWEDARDEARDLDKFAPNWDGADADSVPLNLIRETLTFFQRLEDATFPPPDSVYPAADGTVFVEWHHSDGTVRMANVQPGRIATVTMGPDGSILPQESETRTDSVGALSEQFLDVEEACEFALAA